MFCWRKNILQWAKEIYPLSGFDLFLFHLIFSCADLVCTLDPLTKLTIRLFTRLKRLTQETLKLTRRYHLTKKYPGGPFTYLYLCRQGPRLN